LCNLLLDTSKVKRKGGVCYLYFCPIKALLIDKGFGPSVEDDWLTCTVGSPLVALLVVETFVWTPPNAFKIRFLWEVNCDNAYSEILALIFLMSSMIS